MPDCYAKGCRSRACNSRKNKTQLEWEQFHGQKITFHRIPKDPEKRTKWLNIMQLNNMNIPKNAKLCSLHFAESDFDRTYVNCVRIRPDVIPSKTTNKIGASYKKQKDEEISEEINEEINGENINFKTVKILDAREDTEQDYSDFFFDGTLMETLMESTLLVL
ncbi:THAP domain-containing protein 6-like [Odontomachus brunneus]|uniref:THAP domain-containing protein 6-like n=1 Tax=Odontomachus brunneus TaxID=486640 RepID=UPI0013F282D7|nr:THAP domain-containing protein 6-like [Odontomachus brunneus]XP_032674690.1 THAP domain-containing protein 6-like [Odontomachus brunneus]